MGGAGRAGRSRAAWVGVFLSVPVAWGCASPLLAVDGGFRHAEKGYWVAEPPDADPPWRRAEVEGADLAYRRPGPTWMSLQVRCKGPLTAPQILARHLRIGLPDHTVRQSYPVEASGHSGWVQVLDVMANGRVVRLKTVTLVAGGCAFDWLLSVPGGEDFPAAEGSFDAWWPTLRIDARADRAHTDGRART